MRLSCIILFLGWLAKQQTLSRGQYPKPSIWVSPNHELFLGEPLSIYCHSPYQSTQIFYLQKEGNPSASNTQRAQSNEGMLTISSAQYSHVGKYRCRYCLANNRCSPLSDILCINITEVAYPKPSISVNPSEVVTLGESVSIHCKKEGLQTASFTLQKKLYKLSDTYKTIETKMGENEFPITKVEYEDAGIYRCRYCSQSETAFYQRCSSYSDEVYVNVTEVAYPKPSISVNPSEVVTRGESVSIHCKKEGLQTASFTLQKCLYKLSDTYKTIETKMDENEFPITKVEYEDAGIYRCRYCSQSESAFYQICSNYSDQVYINVTGYWPSKPFIQLTPSEESSPGLNVTIECYGPYIGLTFLLLKSNQVTASKETGQGRNSTKFHLSRVTSGDAGNYTCHYYQRNEFIWSVPSDPVELLLRDNNQTSHLSLYFVSVETWIRLGIGFIVLLALVLILGWLVKRQTLSRGQYLKPSIWMNPNHELFLGESLSIYCRSPYQRTQIFQLLKEGNQQAWDMQITQSNNGIFTISSAQYIHVGKYRCLHCLANNRCSPLSDSLYINITEVAYPKPSISVNPSEVVTLGESVSIHCKTEGLQTANFTLQKCLYKLSDTYKSIETKMGENEFPITKVEYEDAGIYRCRYCSQSESAFYQRCSNYSDQVYINVTGYWPSKPFIQLTPSEESSPDSNVTIECYGPYNGLTFLLLKSNQVTASKETGQGRNSTKFHLSRVTSGDAGNYTCHYYFRNEFLLSVPSDPVELLLRDNNQTSHLSLYFVSVETWIRLGIGFIVLLALVLILAEAVYNWRTK